MRQFLLILIFSIPTFGFGQNPHDSLRVISNSENLVEIVKPLIPEIEKNLLPKDEFALSGAWINSKPYPRLRDGQVKVYNRYYQLIERIEFRDSVLVIAEYFENGKLYFQNRFIPTDSIYVSTQYYKNELPQLQNEFSRGKEIFTTWHENGQLKRICTRIGDKETCDYWDEHGLFKNGVVRKYSGQDIISEVEVDKNGLQMGK